MPETMGSRVRYARRQKVDLSAAPGAIRVVMERTPKRCPAPVSFHLDRRAENLFGGGEDIDVHVAYDLLSSQGSLRLHAQQVGDSSQGCANQGTQLCRLTGSDGDQDE